MEICLEDSMRLQPSSSGVLLVSPYSPCSARYFFNVYGQKFTSRCREGDWLRYVFSYTTLPCRQFRPRAQVMPTVTLTDLSHHRKPSLAASVIGRGLSSPSIRRWHRK